MWKARGVKSEDPPKNEGFLGVDRSYINLLFKFSSHFFHVFLNLITGLKCQLYIK